MARAKKSRSTRATHRARKPPRAQSPKTPPSPSSPRSDQTPPPRQPSTPPSPGLLPTTEETEAATQPDRTSLPRLAGGAGRQPLEVTRGFALADGQPPQGLGLTYWFEAVASGPPYRVSVLFEGRLRGDAPAGEPNTFSVVRSVDGVLPGAGHMSLTTSLPDLPAGTWDVTATPVRPMGGSAATWAPIRPPGLPRAAASGTTTFAPITRSRAPGVRIGAWPLLVAAGAVVALLTQRFLADRVGLHPVQLLLVSLLACLLGVAGAKAYYLATHPAERRNILTAGMSIQGFVLAAVATLLGGSFILGLPIGQVLDVSAPALLAGMAVGRVGCLLGGCCSGRPTTSRWGIWSSDRRLGTVRIPVQLMESAATAVVAVATAAANLVSDGRPAGVIFTTGVGVYVAVRQVLFPLRVLPRATAFGRPVSLLVSVAVSVVSIAIGLSA